LLLSRKAIEEQNPTLLAYLATIPVSMAIAQCDADRDAAQQISENVGIFQATTAIVADFVGCMVVNDDGSVEPIVLPELLEPVEEPRIKLV
jgi:hypothetical protein